MPSLEVNGGKTECHDGSLIRFGEQSFLLAEDAATGRLFAVEKVQEHVFALCRLQSWVSREDLERPAKSRATRAFPPVETKAERWWTPVSLADITKSHISENASAPPRQRLAMKPVGKPADEPTSMQPASSVPTEQAPIPTQSEWGSTSLSQPDRTSSAELISAIRTHYLESLYINRTPLAYFTKGPLSRARVGLRDDPTNFQELVEFLRAHIMNLNTGNKKYDTTLTELIQEIPGGLMMEDLDSQVTTPIKNRIRKSRKRKQMSKGGLLPGEEDYVVRWWVKREESLESGGQDDTRETRTKSGLADLRARETQLQIILILEVLALEAAMTTDQLELAQSKETNEAEAKKKKKPADLNTLLDILIDRLCIWESMNLDTPKKATGQETEPGKKGKAGEKDADSDRLRDFCTEIVVPYYAARLPELYTSIGQKLGGPSLASSPQAMRTPAPKKSQKPGAAVSRAAMKGRKAPEQNERVSKQSRAPLARSVTDSQLPSLKQELSQVEMSNVPRHRPTLQESRRFSQREVDLNAITQATEAKLQRKAAADRELKNAIAALRRPNARLAVKDYVESTEQHKAALNSKSRKAKQPTRNPFATAIQVTATPKVNRQSREAYVLPPPQHAVARLEPSVDHVPPSSEPCVPSSTTKPSAPKSRFPVSLADTPHRTSLAASQRSVDPDATPSRKRAKVVPCRRPSTSLSAVPEIVVPGGESEMGSSPQLPSLQRTPRPVFRQVISEETLRPPALFLTPVKPARREALEKRVTAVDASARVKAGEEEEVMMVGDTPAKAKEGSCPVGMGGDDEVPKEPAAGVEGVKVEVQGEKDIYAALGWDDDGDDLGF